MITFCSKRDAEYIILEDDYFSVLSARERARMMNVEYVPIEPIPLDLFNKFMIKRVREWSGYESYEKKISEMFEKILKCLEKNKFKGNIPEHINVVLIDLNDFCGYVRNNTIFINRINFDFIKKSFIAHELFHIIFSQKNNAELREKLYGIFGYHKCNLIDLNGLPAVNTKGLPAVGSLMVKPTSTTPINSTRYPTRDSTRDSTRKSTRDSTKDLTRDSTRDSTINLTRISTRKLKTKSTVKNPFKRDILIANNPHALYHDMYTEVLLKSTKLDELDKLDKLETDNDKKNEKQNKIKVIPIITYNDHSLGLNQESMEKLSQKSVDEIKNDSKINTSFIQHDRSQDRPQDNVDRFTSYKLYTVKLLRIQKSMEESDNNKDNGKDIYTIFQRLPAVDQRSSVDNNYTLIDLCDIDQDKNEGLKLNCVDDVSVYDFFKQVFGCDFCKHPHPEEKLATCFSDIVVKMLENNYDFDVVFDSDSDPDPHKKYLQMFNMLFEFSEENKDNHLVKTEIST
jgi:hypothetical protein